MLFRSLSITIILLSIFACKTTETVEDISKLSPEISMYKGPCFGTCPVYTLTIYEGGMLAFEGKQYTEKFGLYTKKLSKKAYNSIKKAFEDADLWSMEDHYKSNIADMPSTKISYTKGDKTKAITGDINRPDQLKDLEKRLVSIANSEDWTLQSIPDKEYPENFITDELLISLRSNSNIEDWVKKYPDWKLEVVREIGKDRALYLVKYDNTKFKPALVMNTLSIDEDVKSVEFNKKVSGRQ